MLLGHCTVTATCFNMLKCRQTKIIGYKYTKMKNTQSKRNSIEMLKRADEISVTMSTPFQKCTVRNSPKSRTKAGSWSLVIQILANYWHWSDAHTVTTTAIIQLHLLLRIESVSGTRIFEATCVQFLYKNIGYFLFIAGRYLYTVYIISDGYIGFDQQYDIQLEVVEAQTISHDIDIDMLNLKL